MYTPQRSRRTISRKRSLKLFEELADSTWNWLGYARKLGMGFSEDTVSDLTALEINRRFPNETWVGRVSKQKERYIGFDWMWAIKRSDGRSARYVVQAKKMKLTQSKNYPYGRVKYPSVPPYQIDALEKFSKHINAVPLYCFYNNVDPMVARHYWHCRMEAPGIPQLGCTLVPLNIVRLVHKGQIRNNFHYIHRYLQAIPWRCIFHPKCAEFSLDSVSERNSQSNALSSASHDRGNRIHEYIADRVSDNLNKMSFEEFAQDFDLENVVRDYSNGGFSPMPERFLLMESEE